MQHYPIAFSSKSLLGDGWHYSKIELEALGVLQRLDMFHYYCFTKEICVITDHNPLVAVISKDVPVLSQQLQSIRLHIHQYRVCIIYKPSPDLYISHWLSQNNHTENKDRKFLTCT